MGQTPSTARQDNASTRTLHSTSINSRRPMSFLRRLSNRLHSHPGRRFGRQRFAAAQVGMPPPTAIATATATGATRDMGRGAAGVRRLDTEIDRRQAASISSSTTSSLRRATVAATRAAAAATGPPPPMPFFHLDSRPPTTSSTASTVSGGSSTSELSQMLSEIIATAVLATLPASRQNENDERSSSFFRYVHLPLRADQPLEEQRILPILIVGYHTSDSPVPARPRRSRSIVSTSSSLATLQSIPLSTHSIRTTAPGPGIASTAGGGSGPATAGGTAASATSPLPPQTSSQSQQTSSQSSPQELGNWVIYILGGQNVMPDNPTYEDLLWLSNIIGPARPPTTTQAALDATSPAVSWSDDTKRRMRGTDRCLVCLDDFIPKQSVRVLKCCHVFHQECVDRWLCEAHNSCPVCRGVPVEDTRA